MADLIPSSPGDPDDNRDDRDPKVIGLDSDEADDLLGAISSSTARSVLASLHESPATPSDLATEVDTSLQNVQYHLGNLSEAGLIEVADTRYSEKGREMNVYTPADRALVVVAGREDETKGLKGALTRLIGGVGVLGIGAAVVNRLARTESVLPFGFGTSAGGADGAGGSSDAGGSEAGQSGGSGGDLNATYQSESADATTAADSTTQTATETATTTDGGGGFSIAEATTTADSTTQTAEATRTAAETTRTVTEATQTAAETATATPTPTAVPDTTAAQTATETAVQLTSGSGGLAETIGSLSPGTLFFLGGLTVLLAWVAVGVLRD
ncbi:ArsR family transcriptional regulator [Haloferax sp. Atlit-6N]|uniref:ArsR/SmtB family transcription factor n=1 Tax=unclassified Haloferax TaxID=2625095 RepID=UPI000E23CD94|nr:MULTISPECIES: winged helix-turn-helix domain-containing protein [unclassified Haloferax]RDZ54252.1 ArsR family transcriptional regulator [Haloferax sp. Atlit-4N]REA06092.1 ArsR family transcriptional regulator [Haloferax sp. Atlit-6N]